MTAAAMGRDLWPILEQNGRILATKRETVRILLTKGGSEQASGPLTGRKPALSVSKLLGCRVHLTIAPLRDGRPQESDAARIGDSILPVGRRHCRVPADCFGSSKSSVAVVGMWLPSTSPKT